MNTCAKTAGILIAAGICAASGEGLAQADGAAIPDLRGIWLSESTECHHPEASTDNVVVELEIVEQDGRFVRGTRSWAHEGEAIMDAGGELVTEATEKVVGAIRRDGVTVHFVEQDDVGQHYMQLIDADTLDDVYAESGKAATICMQTFLRQPS